MVSVASKTGRYSGGWSYRGLLYRSSPVQPLRVAEDPDVCCLFAFGIFLYAHTGTLHHNTDMCGMMNDLLKPAKGYTLHPCTPFKLVQVAYAVWCPVHVLPVTILFNKRVTF